MRAPLGVKRARPPVQAMTSHLTILVAARRHSREPDRAEESAGRAAEAMFERTRDLSDRVRAMRATPGRALMAPRGCLRGSRLQVMRSPRAGHDLERCLSGVPRKLTSAPARSIVRKAAIWAA